ncbi:MAG: hypothetical protein ACD_10C00479G0005 [uncultured bacterium]|nr:MAG: hypothetical protein ACD_10C00479G0005 [uncultured bacterium]
MALTETQNNLIGDTTADTMNNIGAVLALLEALADNIATTKLGDDAAAGLTLVFGMLGGAVKAVQEGQAIQ